ncbi:hypothetical protein [Halosolutus halophilus]|uniref:hypothetical protein n=1 Tax=Halosolutus halophilus TaxID=1552990 RepID=UPI0022351102|nr:hypothetical protein [Halosolutus halophilus]
MRLPSHRVAVTCIITGLVLVAGCSTPFSDDETQILIENEHESAYQVTAFQSAQGSQDGLKFDVTTEDGERRIVGFDELQDGANYTNVTLSGAERSVRVPTIADDNSTQFVDDWNESQTTIYVVETYENELVDIHVVECTRDMALTFTTASDGSFTTSSRCAKSVH